MNPGMPAETLASISRNSKAKDMQMVQQISTSSIQPTRQNSFPRIEVFFDGVDYVIERITHSVLNSKILLLVLLGLFVLALEMVRFGKFIWMAH
jgi:hypothetical protein